MSLSNVFAAKYSQDDVPIPSYYRSSVHCLERLTTSGIGLSQLEAKFIERQKDLPPLTNAVTWSGAPADEASLVAQHAYTSSVLDRVSHIRRIASQLGEDVTAYPPLHFPPGKLLDELSLIIAKKERELLESKRAHMNKDNVALCTNYLRGCCTRGVTCSFSHTSETLVQWLEAWVERQIMEHGETTITISEEYGPEAWIVLFDLLAKQATFTSLVLRGANRDAWDVLIAGLKEDIIPTLQFVDIGKNGLGENYPKGVLKLSKALAKNTSVGGLCVGHNALGAAGALSICQSLTRGQNNLTTLNLQSNGITASDPAFGYLCNTLALTPHLVKLNMACNELGVEGVRMLLEACQGMTDLRFLDLGNVAMGDHGATTLGAFLSETDVGSKIRYLNISWNRITYEGNSSLVESLFQHKGLEILRMHYNVGIGRKGAMSLSELIKNCPHLHVLDLRWTSLGDDGAATILDTLLSNTVLKDISIFGNELAPQTETMFHDKMKKRHVVPLLPSQLLDEVDPLTRVDESW